MENKKITEKDKKTLNELIQVNIISKHHERLNKQKPNSLKFINNGNLSSFISYKEMNYRNIPSITTSNFFPNTERGYKTNRKKLTFKPKRLVKLYGGKIPLNLIGKANLDYKKTLYDVEVDEFEKKLNATGNKSKTFSLLENELKNINSETIYGVNLF